ncbi:hypothetical protein ES677_07305 [Bizionia gelidisalsuginis]|uniref:Magnesium citrate secondary transporter n=2 Tax=Bizionia TaxID=283785 RepID=A0A8H2LDT6_9FLAO|nr:MULTISPECIES: hypothetical protein [Bizionia]TYB76030.1 hypothetical protein ES676_06145 [Bizionia saleffrena]TYC13533.1 hypothetical protein ES677_07305 [Bizionia gelidisalsuginis]
MSILKHPLFLVVSALTLAIYFAKMAAVPLPNWVAFYLSDVLCMPIVLSACLATVRIAKQNNLISIPLGAIMALTIYYALYFEWLLPHYNSRYTADIIDVGLYVIGSGLFYTFQKRLY